MPARDIAFTTRQWCRNKRTEMTHISTCRFCRKGSHEDQRPFIKYGTRHYACQPCYLCRKSIDNLSDWQLGQFSFQLLQDLGMVETVQKRLDQRSKNNSSAA